MKTWKVHVTTRHGLCSKLSLDYLLCVHYVILNIWRHKNRCKFIKIQCLPDVFTQYNMFCFITVIEVWLTPNPLLLKMDATLYARVYLRSKHFFVDGCDSPCTFKRSVLIYYLKVERNYFWSQYKDKTSLTIIKVTSAYNKSPISFFCNNHRDDNLTLSILLKKNYGPLLQSSILQKFTNWIKE